MELDQIKKQLQKTSYGITIKEITQELIHLSADHLKFMFILNEIRRIEVFDKWCFSIIKKDGNRIYIDKGFIAL